MVYLYNDLTAQISASKSQNNDFGRYLLMHIDKELPVSLNHIPDNFFFSNSMVTEHIKPTTPHHTTVLTVSVKKNSTTRSFANVISVRLSKNTAKDGTLAKCGRFTQVRVRIHPFNGTNNSYNFLSEEEEEED